MSAENNVIPVSKWGADYIESWFPGSLETARKHIPGIVKLLNLGKPQEILDCPCGWGRYSNPLAELGHKVTGIDITEKFIEMAKDSAPENNAPLFKVGDMRKLDANEKYGIILNLYGSFGYFDRETDIEVLKGFIKALKPGGQLMIDQYNWEKLVHIPKRIWWRSPEGKICLEERTVDLTRGTYHIRDIFLTGSEERVTELTINWYTVNEYRRMLEKLGIEDIRFYGDFDSSEYSVESERQIVIVVKER